MRLVRLFTGRENETEHLERQVNNWIVESRAEVVSITGNVAPQSPTSYPGKQPAPSDILLVCIYEPAVAPAPPAEVTF